MTTRSDSQSMTAAYAAVPGERRSERLDLRVTPTEASFIRQAAASRRQSVTEFLTAAAIQAAERAIEQDRRVVLMNEVFDRLVDEMDGPEEVVPALANLIKRPRRLKLPE
jgi:uncharacterized protein (DUF1778 family)